MSKQRVAILVDKSGSMQGLEEFVITSFNEQVQTIRDKAKDFDDVSVSLVTFNHTVDFDLFDRPVGDIEEFEPSAYVANGGTALRDAIGTTIDRLKEEVPADEQGTVLFVIITDGRDMSSTMFSRIEIAEKIQEMKDKGWTFTYLGTDHDVATVTRDLNIDEGNVAMFCSHTARQTNGVDATRRVTRGLNAYFCARVEGTTSEVSSFYACDEGTPVVDTATEAKEGD